MFVTRDSYFLNSLGVSAVLHYFALNVGKTLTDVNRMLDELPHTVFFFLLSLHISCQLYFTTSEHWATPLALSRIRLSHPALAVLIYALIDEGRL